MSSTLSVRVASIPERETYMYPRPECVPYADFFKLHEAEIIERNNAAGVRVIPNLWDEFLIMGVHYLHINYQAAGEHQVVFKSTQPYVSMVFAEKCKLTYRDENNVLFAEINSNEHQMIFISDRQTNLSWRSEPGGEIFIFNLTLEYFDRFLSKLHPMYPAYMDQFASRVSSALIHQNPVISNRMLAVLYDIKKCNYKADYKRLFIKSRVIELLMLQLERAENSLPNGSGQLPARAQVDKMFRARDIIISDIGKSITLIDLAEQVDTNECYLKKHFKQVFGTTVHAYLLTKRMEKARELLLERNKKVADIAKLAGYRHTSHFSSAFRKYFGYLPTQLTTTQDQGQYLPLS